MDNKLTFIDQVNNLKGVLETLRYFAKTTTEYKDETSELRTVVDNDLEQSMEFLNKLNEVVYGACVLAVYAGEDWCKRNGYGYGFGADSYDYLAKYITGGMELSDEFGTEDFYDLYENCFNTEIRPTERAIDLTTCDIRCCDEVIINDNLHALEFNWELWFDVDKYFGINTREYDGWVNFYTFWDCNTDKVTAIYQIVDDTEVDWKLEPREEKFLREKMKEYLGMSPEEYVKTV